jgi:protein TonB
MLEADIAEVADVRSDESPAQPGAKAQGVDQASGASGDGLFGFVTDDEERPDPHHLASGVRHTPIWRTRSFAAALAASTLVHGLVIGATLCVLGRRAVPPVIEGEIGGEATRDRLDAGEAHAFRAPRQLAAPRPPAAPTLSGVDQPLTTAPPDDPSPWSATPPTPTPEFRLPATQPVVGSAFLAMMQSGPLRMPNDVAGPTDSAATDGPPTAVPLARAPTHAAAAGRHTYGPPSISRLASGTAGQEWGNGYDSRGIPVPDYPPESRRRREQGEVVVEVEVLPDGTAGAISVVTDPGYRRLDDAAIDAARRTRFRPALQDGVPTRGRIRIPFRFMLVR